MNGTASKNITPYIAAGFATAFLIVIAYVMFFVPKMNESTALVEQASTQRASNVELQSKVEKLADTAKNLAPLKAQVAEFNASFPSGPEQQNLLDSINAAAAATGVKLTTLSPDVPKAQEEEAPAAPAAGAAGQIVQEGSDLPGPAPVPAADATNADAPNAGAAEVSTAQLGTVGLKINGTGTMEAVQAFVVRVEKLKRPLLVHEVMVEKTDAGYHVMLRGDTFIAKPLVEPEESK